MSTHASLAAPTHRRADGPPYILVIGLGITQIIGYGSLYYTFAVVEPSIARELGLTSTWTFGCLSVALLLGGFAAPWAGRLIDRHGARPVMALGSVAAALALLLVSRADSLATLAATLVLAEVASAFVLYDAAFAGIAQNTGFGTVRRTITAMTLLGGFASTIFWPAAHHLMVLTDWRTVYAVFAALHIVLCLPLHLLVLRRITVSPTETADDNAPTAADSTGELPKERYLTGMVWLVLSFCLSGFVFSAFTANWVSLLGHAGITASIAIAAGSLMGPSQVAVRIMDMFASHRLHPLQTTAIASAFLLLALLCLMIMGAQVVVVMAFAILFGLGQGLTSIVRGTVPLTLFGSAGYGNRLGKIAALRVVATAAAPMCFAILVEQFGAMATFAFAFILGLLSILALGAIWRLRRTAG